MQGGRLRSPIGTDHGFRPVQFLRFMMPSMSSITPFTSTVIPSSSYLSDPLNAYAHHGMPKPFVYLLRLLSVGVADDERSGTT